MHLKKLAIGVALGASLAQTAVARDIQLELTNLTNGMAFTPRLVVLHTADVDLFTGGTAPSNALAWMAEAGQLDPYNADPRPGLAELGDGFVPALNGTGGADVSQVYSGSGNVADENTLRVFNSLLMPGNVAPYGTMTVPEGQNYLSMVSMLVPTNDAFLGIDTWRIPEEPGTYFININAYDAGTEANDELVPAGRDGFGAYALPGMAVPPPVAGLVGSNGTGVALTEDQIANNETANEGTVHIHRNVLGDADINGGISDLNSTVHRWLNPVARLKVVVTDSQEQR
ncbi:Uncharacterised protein [BD1-7 clade bacterium]|uniref:Spondin domain-containing protein n=1 Tax=BD1-7 clade bacterium TaxID=2029982 RepID=A0A5S9MR11_9GAMM|nr:Uncharacterised protein [BD1-7 clade bacterium]CAA0084847.1 Uncharacterised protein [BD1-7 clade bacterium]